MHKYSLWSYLPPLTCDELCSFYMNYHIKTEDHNNLKEALRDWSLKCWNYYTDFFFFSFSLFFLNNALIEKKTGMFFSFTLRAEIIAASLPLARTDQLAIQTSGKVIIHCKICLSFSLVSESPNEKIGGKIYYLIPTSDFFFLQVLGGCRVKHGKNAAAVHTVDRIHFSLSKSKTLKMLDNHTKDMLFFFTHLQSCIKPPKFGMSWFTHKKMQVDLQKILFSTFGALPTWKQIIFVLRTFETAFLVLKIYIISFSWYTITLFALFPVLSQSAILTSQRKEITQHWVQEMQ